MRVAACKAVQTVGPMSEGVSSRDHIGAWAPGYLESIKREVHAALYRALCVVTRDWIVSEFTAVNDRVVSACGRNAANAR